VIGVVAELARGGDAVVRTAVGAVFVAGALPGERVRIGPVRRSGGAVRAPLVEVLEASPERVAPPCPHASACGGCPWMIASPALQARTRVEMVARAAGVPFDEVRLVPSPMPLRYRRRARLRFEAPSTLGYRARSARTPVNVDACVVLEERLERALRVLRAEVLPHLRGGGEVALAAHEPDAATVVLDAESAQPPAVYAACARLAQTPGIAAVALRVGEAALARWGEPRERGTGVDGLPLVGPLGGFSQAHAGINEALVREVCSLAAPAGADVLELYAGHGNFTVGLAADARSVVAVEQVAEAVAALRENLALRGMTHVRAVCDDAARHVTRGGRGAGRAEVVVLDPPRTGARDALRGIVAHRPRRIVYVGCDTATLHRDVRTLREAGYVPDVTTAFDMFPQTAHVEAVVRLVPAGSAARGASLRYRRPRDSVRAPG
jgi:23S rRNA (uracil1939-C5)-methyltransferase